MRALPVRRLHWRGRVSGSVSSVSPLSDRRSAPPVPRSIRGSSRGCLSAAGREHGDQPPSPTVDLSAGQQVPDRSSACAFRAPHLLDQILDPKAPRTVLHQAPRCRQEVSRLVGGRTRGSENLRPALDMALWRICNPDIGIDGQAKTFHCSPGDFGRWDPFFLRVEGQQGDRWFSGGACDGAAATRGRRTDLQCRILKHHVRSQSEVRAVAMEDFWISLRHVVARHDGRRRQIETREGEPPTLHGCLDEPVQPTVAVVALRTSPAATYLPALIEPISQGGQTRRLVILVAISVRPRDLVCQAVRGVGRRDERVRTFGPVIPPSPADQAEERALKEKKSEDRDVHFVGELGKLGVPFSVNNRHLPALSPHRRNVPGRAASAERDPAAVASRRGARTPKRSQPDAENQMR